MMRVLLLGGTGMLGHKLTQVLGGSGRFDVHASVRRLPTRSFAAPNVIYHGGVDLGAGIEPLRGLLHRLQPDAVINAAGLIKQRDLESAIEKTFFINGTLPHVLPLLNPNRHARVVHFSTDCVFKGDRGYYTERHSPDAEDLYGRSKACGELEYGNHLTIRTSIIGFETHGHFGLLSWLFSQPPGSTLRGFRRAIYSGLPTLTLARTVLDLLDSRPDMRGLFHVASEPLDKCTLLQQINDAFELGHTIVPDDEVRIDRSLNDDRFRLQTGWPRPSWDALVRELHKDFYSLPYAEVYAALVPTRR